MNDFDLKNPFQPKEIKLYNFNPQEIEQNKLKEVQERTQQANGRNGEYTFGYHGKTYSDGIKVPPTYGQIIKKNVSYGQTMSESSSYSSQNNSGMENNEAERIKNVCQPHNNFYENK